MSRLDGIRLVAFGGTSAENVIEKLRREVERVESTGECTLACDHVLNAFWTAWHVHQWMWDAIRERPELKAAVLKYRGIDGETIENHAAFGAALARRFVPLKICRMIATSPRYVHVVLSPQGKKDDLGVVIPSLGSGSDSLLAQATAMVIVMGRPIAAARLLCEVDDYWTTMILDCGIA